MKFLQKMGKVLEGLINVHFKAESDVYHEESMKIRAKILAVQKAKLREEISAGLSSLKKEIDLDKMLNDLGERYIMRQDLNGVLFDGASDLVLRFSTENMSKREIVDKIVPLANYAV